MAKLNSKQARTLAAIFSEPVPSNIRWKDIENLFTALGAQVTQGNGSRVRVALNGVKRVFHEPHPEKTTKKAAVKSIREFLVFAGITGESQP